MESLKSTRVDWKKLIVVVSLVILTGLVIGLGVWYYMDEQIRNEAESYENQITMLETQALTPSDDKEGGDVTQKDDCEESEVTIAYERAGLFEGTEKTDIETKIVKPYIYYMNNVEAGSKVVAVVVDKYPTDERPAGYWFSITGVMDNGGINSWFVGSDGTVDYWAPECMETCELTQAYIDAYPNNLPDDYDLK